MSNGLNARIEADHKAQETFFWIAGIAVTILGVISTAYNAFLAKTAKRRVQDKFDSELKGTVDNYLKDLKDQTTREIARIKLQASADFKTLADYISAMVFAAATLNLDPSKDDTVQIARNRRRQTAIERLEALRDKVPPNRTYYILLGRLYVDMRNLDKAIDVLTDAIRVFLDKYPLDETDRGAFFYNRACYRNKLARDHQKPESEILWNEARGDLTKCFELSPDDRKDARADEDLVELIDQSTGQLFEKMPPPHPKNDGTQPT